MQRLLGVGAERYEPDKFPVVGKLFENVHDRRVRSLLNYGPQVPESAGDANHKVDIPRIFCGLDVRTTVRCA